MHIWLQSEMKICTHVQTRFLFPRECMVRDAQVCASSSRHRAVNISSVQNDDATGNSFRQKQLCGVQHNLCPTQFNVGTRSLGWAEPHFLHSSHVLVPGCPTACPELAPSTNTAVGVGMLVGQNVHRAQCAHRVCNDALSQRLADGHGSMTAEFITQQHPHFASLHLLVVMDAVPDSLEKLRKPGVLHDALKQSRVTPGVHALCVGEILWQTPTAVDCIDGLVLMQCGHQSTHRRDQSILVQCVLGHHQLQGVPAWDCNTSTEQRHRTLASGNENNNICFAQKKTNVSRLSPNQLPC
jgi:hypothetical protein